MKCPNCLTEQTLGTMVCRCGYSFVEGGLKVEINPPTNEMKPEIPTVDDKKATVTRSRWQTFIGPSLVGLLIVNAIVIGVFMITKSKPAMVLSQPIAFIICGLVIGYWVGDIPITAIAVIFIQSFSSRLKDLLTVYTDSAATIGAAIGLIVYLGILTGAAYYAAKRKKKDRPSFVV